MTENYDIEQSLTSGEAAKFLGVSMQKLARLRRDKKVEGTQVGTSNVYIYTVAQLRKADLSKERRGPKPKKEVIDSVQN